MKTIDIYSDGSSINNEAAIGVVIYTNNDLYQFISEPIGKGTNNDAEYSAFIKGLQTVLTIPEITKETTIMFSLDSELVVKQVTGIYNCNDKLRPYYDKAIKYIQHLEKISKVGVRWIPREKNNLADSLSKLANTKYKRK